MLPNRIILTVLFFTLSVFSQPVLELKLPVDYLQGTHWLPIKLIIKKDGNIVLAGTREFEPNRFSPIALIGVSSNGEIRWQKRFGDHANTHKYYIDIAAGNDTSWVVGSSLEVYGNGSNFYILKFDGKDSLFWEQTFDLANLNDILTDIEIDSLNRIYITGYSKKFIKEPFVESHAIIACYSPFGNVLWYELCQNNFSEKGGDTFGKALTLNSEADPQVTGEAICLTSSGIGYYTLITGFCTSGAVLWQDWGYEDFHITGSDIVTDSQDNVIVMGVKNLDWVDYGEYSQVVLLKYSRTGALLWSKNLARWQDSTAVPVGITVDSEDNIWLVGNVWDNQNNEDILITKFDPNGEKLWDIYFDRDHKKYREDASNILLDDENNLYVTGMTFETYFQYGSEYLLLKLSSEGEVLWTMVDSTENIWQGKSMALDGNGNLYVTTLGKVNGPSYLLKYNLYTSIDVPENDLPTRIKLSPNYPNPFNPSTIIEYELPKSGSVRLIVYNLLGQKVRTLVNARQNAGLHRTVWDGCDESGKPMSSGVYFYRLQAEAKTQTKKMMLLR